jgi:hypothetical protein
MGSDGSNGLRSDFRSSHRWSRPDIKCVQQGNPDQKSRSYPYAFLGLGRTGGDALSAVLAAGGRYPPALYAFKVACRSVDGGCVLVERLVGRPRARMGGQLPAKESARSHVATYVNNETLSAATARFERRGAKGQPWHASGPCSTASRLQNGLWEALRRRCAARFLFAIDEVNDPGVC